MKKLLLLGASLGALAPNLSADPANHNHSSIDINKKIAPHTISLQNGYDLLYNYIVPIISENPNSDVAGRARDLGREILDDVDFYKERFESSYLQDISELENQLDRAQERVEDLNELKDFWQNVRLNPSKSMTNYMSARQTASRTIRELEYRMDTVNDLLNEKREYLQEIIDNETGYQPLIKDIENKYMAR